MTTSYGTGAGTHLLCSRPSATWASPTPRLREAARVLARRSMRFRPLAAGFATRRARRLRRSSAPARAAPSLAPLLATRTCRASRRWRRSTSRAGPAARHAQTPLLRNRFSVCFRVCAAAADGWWCWGLELQGEVLRQSQGHQEPSGPAAGTGRALSTNHQHTAKHKPGRLICSLLSLVLRSGTRASPKTRCKPTVRKRFFDFHFLPFAQL